MAQRPSAFNGGRWWSRRENILLIAGLVLIFAMFIVWVINGRVYYGFVALGGAMCGLGITQAADRR